MDIMWYSFSYIDCSYCFRTCVDEGTQNPFVSIEVFLSEILDHSTVTKSVRPCHYESVSGCISRYLCATVSHGCTRYCECILQTADLYTVLQPLPKVLYGYFLCGILSIL